jgi:signal transduction histidine kinase
VDQAQMSQAIHHVVMNAIEAMPDGGVVMFALKMRRSMIPK